MTDRDRAAEYTPEGYPADIPAFAAAARHLLARRRGDLRKANTFLDALAEDLRRLRRQK